jgi:putative phosphoesterase
VPQRLALVGDTHLPRGRRRLPDACIERLRAADLVIHTGDFSSVAAYEEIAGIARELFAVHGNVDDAALRERLPRRRVIEVGGVRIGLIHDAGPARGRVARMQREFADADAVVFGHSHLPLHQGDEAFQIFNPGSPTERRRSPAHTMGLATVHGGSIRFEVVTLS